MPDFFTKSAFTENLIYRHPTAFVKMSHMCHHTQSSVLPVDMCHHTQSSVLPVDMCHHTQSSVLTRDITSYSRGGAANGFILSFYIRFLWSQYDVEGLQPENLCLVTLLSLGQYSQFERFPPATCSKINGKQNI